MTAQLAELYVGIGPRRYRVDRPWAAVPDTVVGWFSAVAVDSRDRVHVFQRFDPLVHRGSAPPVLTFSAADGSFLGSWGDGEIKDAHHLFIDRSDRIFLVDRDAHQIVVFDADGRKLFTIGERDRPGAPFNHPTSVAVAPSGDIYVADGYGGTEVHRLSPEGRLLRTWGGPGRGPGEFTTPHGIWVQPDGRVLVGDRENARVQIFTPEGQYLGELRGLHNPMSVAGAADGTIYVSDQIPRLVAFDVDGRRLGSCRPVLNGGHGIWVDTKGNIYLAEMNPNRITRLSLLDA